MKSVIRNLVGAYAYGILFPVGEEELLEAWSDADCAQDQQKRRFSSKYLINVAGGSVLWASRSQTLTAQSTAEAELILLE